MDTNENNKSIEQLPEFVNRVEKLLAAARSTLDGLADLPTCREALDLKYKKCLSNEQKIIATQGVFVQWNDTDLPAVEKSEVVRALGLIKRANIVIQNTLRLLKTALNIPDPERDQVELQMQLQAMGVIHGGSH